MSRRRAARYVTRTFQALGVVGLALLGSPPATLAAADATAELHQRLDAFIRARAPVPPTRVTIPSLADFALPDVAPERVRVSLRANPRNPLVGNVPITVVESVDGREMHRGTVTVSVQVPRTVLVAARSLPRGTRLRPSDIRREHRVAKRLPSRQVVDPAQLVGRRTRRAVDEGTVWRQSLVRDAPAVSRGELVRLSVRRGSLRIETLGKARDDGRVGDSIRVLNIDSHREVVGHVGDDGTVHVGF